MSIITKTENAGDNMDNVTTTQKLKVIMALRNMTLTDLARALNTTKQNIGVKFQKENWTEKNLNEIAAALGCTYIPTFKFNDSDRII